MVIIKHINAFRQLEGFATEKWDKVGKLVKYIIDNNALDAFDNYVSDEFPNGCDESEFEEFCCKETEDIMKGIGWNGEEEEEEED